MSCFLNFGVNTANALWALRGMVRTQRTCQEILDKWSKGVKDKLENQKLFPLPFTPDHYIQFITEHQMVGESLIMLWCMSFGRDKVEHALAHSDIALENPDLVARQSSSLLIAYSAISD